MSGLTSGFSGSAAFAYSKEHFVDEMMRLEWLKYQVDPAWQKFCEFTYKDIGGPFEKLGIIRKNPLFEAQLIEVQGRAIGIVNRQMCDQILNGRFSW